MGGSKKSSVKPMPKRKPKLDKVFQCPNCSQVEAHCTITKPTKDVRESVASIRCTACQEGHRFRGKVTYLTEPVDIFSDWLDFIANPSAQMKKRPSLFVGQAAKPKQTRYADEEEEEETRRAAQTTKQSSSKKKPASKSGANSKKKIVQDESEGDYSEEEEEFSTRSTPGATGVVDGEDDDDEEYF
ncbi:hypothetical protein BASA81_006107 [Batrachochytrium salamandrivorans]|nr:hypothetical protein BASA81_006107 [Batrachochytrium salamandrivorans]